MYYNSNNIKVFDGNEWVTIKVNLSPEEAVYWLDVITRWGGYAIIVCAE